MLPYITIIFIYYVPVTLYFATNSALPVLNLLCE